MIFRNINDLVDSNDKKFFIEKVNIINQLIIKFCKKIK